MSRRTRCLDSAGVCDHESIKCQCRRVNVAASGDDGWSLELASQPEEANADPYT